MKNLQESIQHRRAIYPDRFNEEEITPDQVRRLLEAARYAPTHKLTEPWRFHVLMDAGKARMADRIRAYIEQYSDKPEKGARLQKKFEQSQAVIVISFQRDQRERLPEWEEIAATAMAVQNIWIYAGELEMGGYWSTGSQGVQALNKYLPLEEGERILGMFFLGRYDTQPRNRPSKSVDKFTKWIQ